MSNNFPFVFRQNLNIPSSMSRSLNCVGEEKILKQIYGKKQLKMVGHCKAMTEKDPTHPLHEYLHTL